MIDQESPSIRLGDWEEPGSLVLLTSQESFSDTWQPFTGPHGGHGWRNASTGTVVYGDKPGEREPAKNDPHKAAAAVAQKGQSVWDKVGAAGQWMKSRTKAVYSRLEARYGRGTAIAIFASGVALGIPLFPLPGSSFVGMVPGLAIAETYLQARKALGSLRKHSEDVDELTLPREQIVKLGKELVKRLTEEWKQRPGADVETFAEAAKEVATADWDGDQAEELLANAKSEGTRLIARLARNAVQRALVSPGAVLALSAKGLLTEAETVELAQILASTTATAELLGRARVRMRAIDKTPWHQPTSFAAFRTERGLRKFDESGLHPLAPAQAIDYFKSRVPSLNVNVDFFKPLMERQAFTLAVATERELLDRVKAAIQERLETGRGISTAPKVINELCDAAGVGPVNKGYGEMVFRTNMMEAYRAGAQREFSDPDLAEDFPVWRYIGIKDGRDRHGPAPKPDHRQWFGKYFSRDVLFADVRGRDISQVAQCRCGFVPIYKADWKRLQAGGAKITTDWMTTKAQKGEPS